MRIKLDNKNHYLVSDEHNCWIVTECKTAKGDTYDRRQSGYYGDIDGAMQSYFDKSQRLADASTFEELLEETKKIKKEISGWTKVLRKEK